MMRVRAKTSGSWGNPVPRMFGLVLVSLLVGTLFGAAGWTVATAEPEEARQDTAITDWVILPVMFHTPETGIGGGIAGSYLFPGNIVMQSFPAL